MVRYFTSRADPPEKRYVISRGWRIGFGASAFSCSGWYALEHRASANRCAAEKTDRSWSCEYPERVALLHSESVVVYRSCGLETRQAGCYSSWDATRQRHGKLVWFVRVGATSSVSRLEQHAQIASIARSDTIVIVSIFTGETQTFTIVHLVASSTIIYILVLWLHTLYYIILILYITRFFYCWGQCQCQSEIFSVALTAELSRRPRQRRQKAKTE